MAGWLEEESFIFRHGLSLPFVDTYTRYTERQGVDKHDIHTHKNGKWWTIRLATRHLGSPSVSHRVSLELLPVALFTTSKLNNKKKRLLRIPKVKKKKILIFFQENKNLMFFVIRSDGFLPSAGELYTIFSLVMCT